MRITFGLPSVFVFPFGGSMITRVSIDPPSIWVCKVRSRLKYSPLIEFSDMFGALVIMCTALSLSLH